MGTFVSNRDSGGKTNEEGHFRLPLKVWQGYILDGLQVNQNGTPNMTVNVSKGDGQIPYGDYAHAVWTDGNTTGVTVTAADTVNPRKDRVVAYVDRGMSFTASDINNPGALKFKAVNGTAASTPALPNDTVVQTSVGVGNPWIELATLDVPANATAITTARITDTRVFLTSQAITRAMYPVGSVYINSVVPTNPATLFGFGTWVQFGAGRVPVGIDTGQSEFDTAGETGGAKTHTLTQSEMPSHQHSGTTSTNGDHNHGISWVGTSGGGYGWRDASNARSSGFAYTSINGAHNHSFTTSPAGSGGAHNNLQPYVVVYMWTRTA